MSVTDQEDEEAFEDQEANALERRWRQGSAATLIVFLMSLGFFWVGIYLLTQ